MLLSAVLLALSLQPTDSLPNHSQLSTLNSQLVEIDEIVVTASRVPRELKQVPIVTSVIPLARIQSAAPQSLSDLLAQELPGIEFTRVEGQISGITFQGLEANYLLILVDGRRMAGETTRSNPDLNRIDVDHIERIEIVRGAMSTLYGSGAVAGVINIITKQPANPLEISVNGQYDTGGEQHYGARVGSKGKRLSGSVSGTFRDAQPYFLESRGAFSGGHMGAPPTPGEITEEVEIEGFRNYSVTGQVAYGLADELHASAHGQYYDHERMNAGRVGERVHDLYRDLNGGAALDWRLQRAGNLTVSYDFDRYTKLDKYLLLKQTERNYRNTIQNPKALYSNELRGGHLLVAGVEWLGERLETYQFSQGDRRGDNFAAYAQFDWLPTARLTLQGGLRGDRHSGFGAHVSPRLSAMYRLDDFIFRVGYAGAFRAPTLKELYTDWDHQGLFRVMGNAGLAPETSRNFSASIEYTRGRINLTASAFHNRIEQKIATVWNATADTLRYANATRATIAGLNLSAAARLGTRWTARANYAYIHDYQQVDGKNTSAVRPHSATAHLSYAIKSDWTIAAGARWNSAIDQWAMDSASDSYVKLHYPGYAICKLSASGTIVEGLRLTAGVDNLFDYTPGHVTFNAGITPGRTFFIALRFSVLK